MIELWRRLNQRKLVQWAVAYVAAAFALLQGEDIIAQRFDWPESITRVLIIVSCVGFFVTLVLAWYHGERGVQRVHTTEVLLLMLLLVIGGGLTWRVASYVPPASTSATTPAVADRSVIADRKATAVLPFVNMSDDKNNQYLSDGISEEILNVLAKAPDLRVAARTSSISFQDKKIEIPEIAHALNVRMVPEGSIRKQGDRVGVTTQLIDAKPGFQVWSETYDRDLKDIFAIQDEIAQSIGSALEVTLGNAPEHGKNSVGTTNLKAYDLYLRGIGLWQLRDEKELWQAVGVFDEAIAEDPEFAQAYAGLSMVYTVIYGYSSRMPYAETIMRATDNAERALLLDASSAKATPHWDWSRRWKTDVALQICCCSDPSSCALRSPRPTNGEEHC